MATHLCIWKGRNTWYFFFLSLHRQSLLLLSVCTSILSERVASNGGERGLKLQSAELWSHLITMGLPAQDLCTPAVQCDRIAYHCLSQHWHREGPWQLGWGCWAQFNRGGGCRFIKLPTFSRTIMEHVLHVLLESISSAQRERLWWTTSRESWGQFMLAQGVCLLGSNGWLDAQRKSHEFSYRI